MTVDDLLRSPMRLFAKAQKARELAEILEAQATKTTSQLTGMPGGGSDKEQTLARLADARDEWFKYARLSVDAMDYVYGFIIASALTDREKRVLCLRYLGGAKWPEVVETVRKEGYEISERTAYRLHNSAVEKLGGFNEEDTYFVSESL